MNDSHPYKIASLGFLKGIRSWSDFDDFWCELENLNDGKWFVYDTNKTPPSMVVNTDEFSVFLKMTHQVLHQQHKEEYCGIVYVNSFEEPTFIKIYDPANLGVVCGFSDNPPLPGWILSRIQPCDLHTPEPVSIWKKYLHRFT